MKYQIENESIIAEISAVGGELKSLVCKEEDREYMWSGNEEYWKETSPLLFPITGRLYEGVYRYRGKEYSMGLHGFARNKTFQIKQRSENRIVLFFCGR